MAEGTRFALALKPEGEREERIKAALPEGSMEESFNPRVEDTSDQEDDTLSLSDLPIYGDGGGGETPGKDLVLKEYTSSLSFEFFSEDWSSTILKGDPTDQNDPTVVFCGKIIPDKETPASENTLGVENKTRRKLGYRSLAWWNFNSLSKSSSYKSTGSTSGRSYLYKGDQKDEIPVGRVSIVTTTAPKTKWYLYIFGLGRFPPKMHVRDLRRRQGSSRTSKRSDGVRIVGGGGDGGSSSKGVGWWALIRVLGCAGGGDDHANAVVKATYGLAPGTGV